MGLFVEFLQSDPRFFLRWIVVVSFSICVHEWAHAYTAYRCGDDTAAREGHLTLNPLVQMGPLSLVFLCLIGLAWGSVPVDVSLLRKRSHEAWVAFAGPLSNLVLCLLFGMAAAATAVMSNHPAMEIFRDGCLANAGLFLLNMLPVPVLDGWRVYAHFVPRMKWIPRETAMTYSNLFLIVFFLTPSLSGLLWRTGYSISTTIMAGWQTVFQGIGLGA
jgi:Zn-dependent protease